MRNQQWQSRAEMENLRAEVRRVDARAKSIFEAALDTDNNMDARFLIYLAGVLAESVESAKFTVASIERGLNMLGPIYSPVDFTAGYNSGLDAGYLGHISAAERRMQHALETVEYVMAIMSDYRNGHSGPAETRLAIQRLTERASVNSNVRSLLSFYE